MTRPESHDGRDDGIDRVLRESLRDDLPEEVESRLTARWREFAFSRRWANGPAEPRGRGERALSLLFGWTPARVGLAAAATLLLVSGLTLQAAVAPGSTDQPVRRIQLSVSLVRALRDVASLSCAGIGDPALDSPESLATSVYRRWVPEGAWAGPEGSLVAAYRSVDSGTGYELVLDAATRLPREIRSKDAAAGLRSATCTWTTAATDRGARR